MLKQIIYDAKAMETEAAHSEADAKKTYEALVESTTKSTKAKQADITNKSQSLAKAKSTLVEAKESKDNINTELEQIANQKAELGKDCDWVQDNFDVRQTARDEEVEALKQAKAILSGAKFNAFLQAA